MMVVLPSRIGKKTCGELRGNTSRLPIPLAISELWIFSLSLFACSTGIGRPANPKNFVLPFVGLTSTSQVIPRAA